MTGGAVARRAGQGARVAAILLIAVLLAAPVLAGFIGYRFVVVDGGSMSPTFERGDVIVTRRPTGQDLIVGRTVLIGTGPTTYVHRVVERDGDRAKLRGDANAIADPGWVTQADVSGTVAAHLRPPWSRLVVVLTGWPGRIALVGALVGVLALLGRSAGDGTSGPMGRLRCSGGSWHQHRQDK